MTEADVNNMEYTFSRMIELPHLAVIISAYLYFKSVLGSKKNGMVGLEIWQQALKK